MTQAFGNQGWNVGRSGTVCTGCGQVLQPGQVCYAALCEGNASVGLANGGNSGGGMSLLRQDFCENCWQAGRRPEAGAAPATSHGPATEGAGPTQIGALISFWKSQIPVPSEKKRLFVDDAVLIDLFSRLESKEAPQDVRFRFVLALILMRKRILRYDASRPRAAEAGGGEDWDMVLRGSEKENRQPAAVQVINPNLTPEQISEVSQQLSQILAEEM